MEPKKITIGLKIRVWVKNLTIRGEKCINLGRILGVENLV